MQSWLDIGILKKMMRANRVMDEIEKIIKESKQQGGILAINSKTKKKSTLKASLSSGKCYFCNRITYIFARNFENYPADRIKEVRHLKLCINCLKKRPLCENL